MATLFDVITVTCFLALALAFFVFTDRRPVVLSRMMVCAVAFAVANQLGNTGWTLFAAILIVAGSVYAVYIVRD